MPDYQIKHFDELDMEFIMGEERCSAYELFLQEGICFPGWYYLDPYALMYEGPFNTVSETLAEAKRRYPEGQDDGEVCSVSHPAGWHEDSRRYSH